MMQSASVVLQVKNGLMYGCVFRGYSVTFSDSLVLEKHEHVCAFLFALYFRVLNKNTSGM